MKRWCKRSPFDGEENEGIPMVCFCYQNMLERRSKTFNYILRINCRGIRWYVCGQRKPQKPTPMVKSISLSRKNTIQSSENFVGTDWIFQQILSISAAKQGDGWIKELCSVNDIFQILFGIQLHRNVFGTICSILFPEKISTQLNEATDRLGPCCKMVFTSILLYVQLGFCRTTKQNHWKVIWASGGCQVPMDEVWSRAWSLCCPV